MRISCPPLDIGAVHCLRRPSRRASCRSSNLASTYCERTCRGTSGLQATNSTSTVLPGPFRVQPSLLRITRLDEMASCPNSANAFRETHASPLAQASIHSLALPGPAHQLRDYTDWRQAAAKQHVVVAARRDPRSSWVADLLSCPWMAALTHHASPLVQT